VYGFSKWKKLTSLYIPTVAPYFLAACKSTLGLAWKAGISAEILCTPKRAIGTELYLAKTYLETADLFAWTLVIILLSIAIEKLFVFGISKLGSRLRVLR
jgi:NitT/TauT family transport system permease protein